MFSRNRRVAVLAFLIAAFLMLGDANGFTELPALTLAVERGQETAGTTNTTLASPNPPAATQTTTTPTTTISNAARQLNLKSETTSATSVTPTASSPSSPHDEVRLAMVGVATSKSLGNSDVPEQSAATKSFLGHDKQTENVENGNEGAGNAVKIAQIKYAKEQLETEKPTRATKISTATTSTATPTTPATTNTESAPTGNALANTRAGPLVLEETTFRLEQLEPTLYARTNEVNPIQKTTMTTNGAVRLEEESAVEATDGRLAASTSGSIRVERQLENGLVHIKLSKIVTDGFNDVAATTENAQATITEKGQISPSTAVPTSQLLLQEPVHMPHAAFTGSKINIADLYPLKTEDFNPIIRDSNAKLLKERTIFSKEDAESHRQNLLPNEVEVDQDAQGPVDASANRAAVILNANKEPLALRPTVNHHLTVTASGNPAPHQADADSISDFTGKLLAEQDGVITEIEQKFRLNEFVATESSPGSSRNSEATKTKANIATNSPAAKPLGWHSVNHRTLVGHDFIDRRVKKSFDFPMHRLASDALVLPHVDFANTKFNTDTNVLNAARSDGQPVVNGDKVAPVASHPEFSTTKFYNSQELYNQLLQHQREMLLRSQQLQQKQQNQKQQLDTSTTPPNQVTSFDSSPLLRATTTTTTGSPIALASPSTSITKKTTTTTTTIDALTTPSLRPVGTIKPASSSPSVTSPKAVKKYVKELKRAKLLLKGILSSSKDPLRTTTTTSLTVSEEAVTPSTAAWASASSRSVTATTVKTVVTSSAEVTDNTLSVAAAHQTTPSTVTTNAPSSNSNTNNTSTTSASWTADSRRTTNPTKSSSKPIARPRVLSRLQEKINALECEIQNIPQDSHLWRGNETHELMLPIVIPMNCKSKDDCTTVITSWEGEAEIQSGDILIVEINDALLNENEKTKLNSGSHSPQVYQVTRSGHEHCDVTEGILLDITPLVVDGRKLVTLYDKDLTEGVNLLIVVSELWGNQCVRLKVTTKTDNCGENADCSGKGVCFSNPSMEEYECQCCSGFAGPHCEEIDACTPSPCTNNGICVDLSQGHEGNSYQCLCPYGYTGKNCQYEADPCNPVECLNGGSCVGNSTHFRCDCSPGYTGPLCQHSLNECESSPCVHGICVDQEDGFRCFCQPGFAGELCNFEYNECESNPCQNAGECIDHIGSYECRCSKGFMGSRCQIKVDLCANKPCPAGHRCIDHGNDFSCECPGGQNGPDCNQLTRTQCNVNPCTHGGTCWSSGDSFYCACRPGYTGNMCEDEFVVETVISSSEFMVDDTSARNFNEKTFGSTVVLKSPIELHNAYFGAGVLAAAIFIVAIVVTICHCKVNQTYRKFSTRSSTFFPILGFGRRPKSQSKLNKHWLSGKGLGTGNPLRASSTRSGGGSGGGGGSGHLPATNGNQYTTTGSTALQHQQQQHIGLAGQLHERPFQRHLAMNLENDMYFTVDYSETSQHSPLIQ